MANADDWIKATTDLPKESRTNTLKAYYERAISDFKERIEGGDSYADTLRVAANRLSDLVKLM
jgi:hypothetical protein